MVRLQGKCSRVLQQGRAFEILEPYALKGARTVLRGLGASDGPWLPDPKYLGKLNVNFIDIPTKSDGDFSLWMTKNLPTF
jgi:hypothetical protein